MELTALICLLLLLAIYDRVSAGNGPASEDYFARCAREDRERRNTQYRAEWIAAHPPGFTNSLKRIARGTLPIATLMLAALAASYAYSLFQ